MKPLLPVLRERKRYVAFEILTEDGKKPSFKDVSNAIWQGVLAYIGQLGAARAGIHVLAERYNPEKMRGIVRVAHTSLDEFRASLTMIREIAGSPVIVRSVGVSGILKKAAERYL